MLYRISIFQDFREFPL